MRPARLAPVTPTLAHVASGSGNRPDGRPTRRDPDGRVSQAIVWRAGAGSGPVAAGFANGCRRRRLLQATEAVVVDLTDLGQVGAVSMAERAVPGRQQKGSPERQTNCWKRFGLLIRREKPELDRACGSVFG